jgi:hypothetical protein
VAFPALFDQRCFPFLLLGFRWPDQPIKWRSRRKPSAFYLLLSMGFLSSGRFRVYIWSGISAGWLPASSLRDRAEADRFASLLRKVRGADHVYKVGLA